jgi:Raf kinase inhibitor-like YbhB/YbcL family protein
MTLQLTSSAFPPGGQIPRRFTCEGNDASPAFAWSGASAGTQSFALVCADPDAPAGTWYHWAIYDIPAATAGLGEGHPAADAAPPQAKNDFGRPGYGGPCPPHGHGVHHYHFTLYALDVVRLDLHRAPLCREVEQAARAHALATAELVGLYSR